LSLDIAAEQTALEAMTTGELVERYAEITGERSFSRNRVYLVRRILWRLQANAYGGLSQRALERAEELARDADVRVTAPRHQRPRPGGPRSGGGSREAGAMATEPPRLRLRPVPPATPMADPRLPRPGTTIVRRYRGVDHLVTVRDDGLEYDGILYGSLSAVAKAITGSHCNGYRWFALTGATGGGGQR